MAYNAGWHIHQLAIEDVGYDKDSQQFLDLNNQPIDCLFKLYPLEWMTTTEYAPHMLNSSTTFIEPAWKLLLSNKVLLAKLWQNIQTTLYYYPLTLVNMILPIVNQYG